VEKETKGKVRRVIRGKEASPEEARELGHKLEETRGRAPHVMDVDTRQRCVQTSRPRRWVGRLQILKRSAKVARDMDITLDTTPRVVGRTPFWRLRTVKW
jgi:hypothetical protein